MKLTSIVKFGIVNIVRKRDLTQGAYLPLYSSKTFQDIQNLDDAFTSQSAASRFKQILPSALLSNSSIYQPKFLVTKLQFNPESESLKIITLRPRGFLTQDFHISNILPWSYRDMMAMSKWPQPTLPPFLDDQMIYLNKLLKECYIFEHDGVWNQQTIQHPKLSLQQRFDQKQWFDRWSMV